jgi:hypothetical protein
MMAVRKRSGFSSWFLLLAALPHLLDAQTTVTLSTSPNPSVFGAPVVLAATVTPSSATGRVTFFDGVNILGTKPVSSGAVSLSTVLLSAGSHKLTAYYRDDVNSAAGTSNAVTQTVRSVASAAFVPQAPVNFPFIGGAQNTLVVGDFNGDAKADVASLGQDTGSWWQVDLGASAAIGYITIWNRTDCCGGRLSDYWIFASNTPFSASDTPATLQNRPGTFSSHQTKVPNPSTTIPVNGAAGRYVRVQLSNPDYLSLAEVQVFGAGAQAATNLALGKAASQSSTDPGYTTAGAASAVDGNTDGNFFDGSVTSTSLYLVSILLGKGDGTFQPPVNYAILGYSTIALGDFNGYGNTDLAILAGNINLSILLGNGDGTFRHLVDYPRPSGFSLVVGDFNGDGKADIVISSAVFPVCNPCGIIQGSQASAVSYLLPGNGDGTFGASIPYSVISYTAAIPNVSPSVMADFNGDGAPDLAFVTNGGPTTFVIPGNGNGTSKIPVSSLGAFTNNLIAGDFNGDGKTDLAGGTSILLGNGDGTFRSSISIPGIAMATGDFNGDGILDLVIADSSGNTSGILWGNGDGTFRQGVAIFAGAPLAVADFNGDGRADILTASPGGITLMLGAATGGPASLAATGGTPQSTAVGTPFPTALQVAVKDASGNPLSGVTVTFTVPTVGASALLLSTTAITDASGVASVNAIANNIAGNYLVIAGAGSVTASFSLTNFSGSTSNLALGKPTSQSSYFPGYISYGSLAVDGNTNGNFSAGSVTATNLDSNAWWEVDLGISAIVNSIVIWNRTDCCGDRLSDYWIFVSDIPFLDTDTPASLQNRVGTFASHQTSAPNPSSTIAVNGAQGRYIRVQLTGTNYLSLAEVQVSGTVGVPPVNLARGKLAMQSSTLAGYAGDGAASAVDGDTDGIFGDGSVTATNADANAWWQVDLGTSATINSIVIWNRTDCCGSRLSDYWVFLSNTPFLPTDTPATLQGRAGIFSSHQTTAPNPFTTIAAGVVGRYVRVQLTGANYLSLAEVQVFGTIGPPPTDLAQGKLATQSSTFPGYATDGAAAAVDGNTDGIFSDGSVTATNADLNAWWQVDLGASATISSIVIWNRTDCCGDRLNDYWVFVSDTPFGPADTPSTLQSRFGVTFSHWTAAPNPSTTVATIASGLHGRYVRVQLTGTNYLSLAEVQVFGQ